MASDAPPAAADAAETSDFNPQPGEIVWAKMRGFPWWPGRVERMEDVPEIAAKEKRKKDAVPVLWCGTFDYGFFTPSELKPYLQHRAEFTKKLDKKLREALTYADSPDKMVEELARRKDAEAAKKRKLEEKEVAAARKRQKKAEKDAKKEGGSGEETEEAKAEKKRLKKEKKEEKKRKKEEKEKRDVEDSSKPKKSKAKEKKEGGAKAKSAQKAEVAKTDPVMKCRIKLQKFLSENLDEEQMAKKAADVLADVEAGDFSMEALRETKLAKVIKKLASKDIKNDVYKIVPRSQALINKWTESNLHGDDDAPTPTTKEAHEEVTVSKGADVAAVGEKEEDVTEAPAPPAVAAEAESAVEAQKASAVEVEIGGDAEKGDKDKGDGEDARMEDAPDAEAPAAAAADQ